MPWLQWVHLAIFGSHWGNTLRPKQNGRHFPDDIFKCIFLNKNVWNSIKISLKFVSKGPINNIPALVQIMAWRQPGDKTLSEPMMVSLLTHIYITRSQWVNSPPCSTCPQSCNVNDVRLFSLSTRTTPWLRPCIESTPRPVALEPVRPGLVDEMMKIYLTGIRESD